MSQHHDSAVVDRGQPGEEVGVDIVTARVSRVRLGEVLDFVVDVGSCCAC